MKKLTILEAMADPEVFGPHFQPAESWTAWRSFLAALFALPMDEQMLATYRSCTGRDRPPPEPSSEAWLCCGRRGGKSRILALIATYLACFQDWSHLLSPGEVAQVQVVAADRKQARAIFRYAKALLLETPMLAPLVLRATGDTIELGNGVCIEIASASFRTVRGYTVVAGLVDEIAFLPVDETAARPDSELIAAMRFAMLTTLEHGAMLLCASSPHARKGELFQAYQSLYGREDAEAIFWKASTPTMNPAVSLRLLERLRQRDPARATAEIDAEFRTDVEQFLTRELVDAVTPAGRYELPPERDVQYVAFADPAGGTGRDSFTLAVAHVEVDGNVVLDCVRERKPPFSPDAVTAEYCALLKTYSLPSVYGDHYAGSWPAERFKVHGISYNRAPMPTADLYISFLPLVTSARVELLDHQVLRDQLVSLERKPVASGKDRVDHPRNGHDDVATSVAGALVMAESKRSTLGPVTIAIFKETPEQRYAAQTSAMFGNSHSIGDAPGRYSPFYVGDDQEELEVGGIRIWGG